MPNTQGAPSPIVVERAFQLYKPDTSKFIFSRQLLGRAMYRTPFVSYDVVGSPTGRLSDGSMDSPPVPTPARTLKNVSLLPLFRHRSNQMRPSDAVNQRAPGRIDVIDPAATIMGEMEAISIAIEVETEIMSLDAMTGTLQPQIHGANGATYTYPVQTQTISVLWSDLELSNPIADIINMVKKARGKGYDPVLYIPLTVAGYLAQNAKLVALCAGSVYADKLGPGTNGPTVVSESVGALLKLFTGVKDVVCYDEGYQVDDGSGGYTFTPFMAQNKVVMVAKPPENQKLGEFCFTPTVNNGGFNVPTPGPFLKAFDKSLTEANGAYELHGGFSGVPALVFPECVIWATVA